MKTCWDSLHTIFFLLHFLTTEKMNEWIVKENFCSVIKNFKM